MKLNKKFLIASLAPFFLTACGTGVGPSILDHPASLKYGDVVLTRGVDGGVKPVAIASNHSVIPARFAFSASQCTLPAGEALNVDNGNWYGVPTVVQAPLVCTMQLEDSRANKAFDTFNVTVKDLWTDAGNTVAGYQQGAMTSTMFDGSVLRLVTSSNQSSLDASWAPEWDHLKAYYQMDNDWLDSSGHINHGNPVFGAPTFTASSKVGPAAGSFDGSSYVSVASSPSLNFTTQMTVMTWIYITASPMNFWLFSKNAPGFASGFGIAFDHNTGQVWPHLGIANGLHNPKSIGATAFNQWNHVVVTYNGSNIITYINGVLDSTTPQTGLISTNANELWIGNSPGSPTEYLKGRIDELAIYDIALTATEIEGIYARQLPQFSGSFSSRVFDNLTPIAVKGIRWQTSVPNGKELTGDADGDGAITAADSETSAAYPSLTATLMDNMKSLWHFDETGSGSGGVGKDFKDSSAGGKWLTSNGGTTYKAVGRFNYAAGFDGSTGYVSASDAGLPSAGQARTVSVWVNPTALPGNNAKGTLIAWGTAAAHQGYGISLHNDAGTQMVDQFGYSDDLEVAYTLPLYVWSHIVTTFDGATAVTYVNGKSVTSHAQALWNTALSGTLSIGRTLSNAEYFNGYIDEVAIWNRALSSDEVVGLYRRGANRLSLQVRSCSEATCTVGPPSWSGPDGTSLTYFSELYNAAGNAQAGAALTQSPSMLFSSFGTSVSNAIGSQRYFQYRVLMESDDANNLCTYNGVPAGCSPELKTVTTGPEF